MDVDTDTQENKLLLQAINAFQAETGLVLDIVQEKPGLDNKQVDALVRLPNQAGTLAIEIKRWAQQANIGALAEQIRRLPMEALLAADYINPNMAQKLKALNVQFIDGEGNAYINHPPLYIYITGNKQTPATKDREKLNRAFDATGLKLIFGLLCDPNLLNQPYREIAKQTGIALGAVGKALKGLADAGFLIDKGRGKERRLIKKQKLLDRWVETYPEKLRPKLLVGEFLADDPHWWQHINIEEYSACWGGEVAAAKYTGYLKPQNAILYLPERAGNTLLAKARLRKNTAYNDMGVLPANTVKVKIYRPFWPEKAEQQSATVHPILVYADLIATGDSRNLETARMIHEQYIAEHIREA